MNIKLLVKGWPADLVNSTSYDVAVDINGFPYIVINREKFVVVSTVFPRIFNLDSHKRDVQCELDILCGLTALKNLLKNPELVPDVLTEQERRHLA